MLAGYAQRVGLIDLVHRHGTPLLVVDGETVDEQLLALSREFPGARLRFATAALPHPAVLRSIHARGASFCVSSRSDIAALAAAGIPLGECLHSHPVKGIAEITGAYAAGIRRFVVDSPCELAKFDGLPFDISILVRIGVPGPGPAKFGATRRQVLAIAEEAVRLRIRVAGIAFHVSGPVTDGNRHEQATRRAIALMSALAPRLGDGFDTLDIGGGFPAPGEEGAAPIETIARGIRSALATPRGRRLLARGLRLVIEPGRFIAAPALTLVTRVIGTSERPDGAWHYLDDGVDGTFAHNGSAHPDLTFSSRELDEPAGETVGATLAGPSCDESDVIARDLPLPRLTEGDLVIARQVGAYTVGVAQRLPAAAPAVAQRVVVVTQAA